ncbi:calcium/sodium antiporter [Agromyces sp. Marseille-P2726]|uniref:calcium/sodium antiporter n=1 Tax=Agromyces sp. Marseille-P2726 TaxID=2709132 RepID=UPI00156D6F11|nr:calcium/sodium antiporter [Agromyces sp. Marseille-P2726]
MAALVFIVGVVAVIGGAELVVRGGAQLAARLGISPLIIGLTIVAIGTSFPELAVGIDAALQGNGALAVGNIAGTNTFNLLFILGLVAVIRPLPLGSQTIRFDLPFIIGAAFVLFLMGLDGWLTTLEGVILIAGAVLFTVLTVRNARRESVAVRAEFDEEYAVRLTKHPTRQLLVNAVMLLVGLVIIGFGADWLVDGAVELARLFGVSDAFIGLTIVAIGTSAPEIVTAIVATLRNERDIAVGNLIGSSVYNILLILGVTSVVPIGDIPVPPELAFVDIPVMVAATLACMPVFISHRRVSRLEGAIFVSAYLAYFAYLVISRT